LKKTVRRASGPGHQRAFLGDDLHFFIKTDTVFSFSLSTFNLPALLKGKAHGAV
jgi:hypothetical protein